MSELADTTAALEILDRVVDNHEGRISALEPKAEDSARRLDAHEERFGEYAGYLAMLDRGIEKVGEAIEVLKAIQLSLGRAVGELRRGQNGR